MNRRSLVSGLASLVGGVLLEKAIPFGRVWSFPKEVKCLNSGIGYLPLGSLSGFPLIIYNPILIKEWQTNTPFLSALHSFKPIPRRKGLPLKFYERKGIG